jgi:hypothetical protein
MCSNVENILEMTRSAETAFDIVFVINIIVTFLTASRKILPDEDIDLSLIFKESAIKYAK